MKFNRILCGVDFSRESVRAFDAAVEIARTFKAELHIMHVIEAYPVVSAPVSAVGADVADKSLEEKAEEAMGALVATAAKAFNGTPVTTEVTRSRASDTILDRARKVDLIVLGNKGLTLPEEVFLC